VGASGSKIWNTRRETRTTPSILADADAELDDRALRIPPGVGRKTEEHGPPEMFC
jgi:hypothetical protein